MTIITEIITKDLMSIQIKEYEGDLELTLNDVPKHWENKLFLDTYEANNLIKALRLVLDNDTSIGEESCLKISSELKTK